MPGSKALEQPPVEGGAVAAGENGALRRLGVEQQPVGDTDIAGGGGEVGRFAYADRLHDLPAEALPDRRDPLGRLRSVELEPVGIDRGDDGIEAGVIHVDD